MRANFEANAPVAVQNEARCLVEFCIFRYLARRGADFHPSLQVCQWFCLPVLGLMSFLGAG